LTSCSIKIPDIKVTGEKTALENQIMGEYKQIKEDAWMVASERGTSSIDIPLDRKEVIEAVRNREFNKDDVDEFKVKKIFGEEISGFMSVPFNDIYMELEKKEKMLADRILKEENRDRKIIIERISKIGAGLKEKSSAEIAKAFFYMNLEDSPEGTYYKTSEGNWEDK